MTTLETAKAALDRVRLAIERQAPADPQDVETLTGYLQESERAVSGAVDLLAQSNYVFRGNHANRARKLLEELIGHETKKDPDLTSIEVDDSSLGGRMTTAQIRSVAAELLRDRPGVWSISIRGSQTNDMWEGQVKGPYNFAFKVEDIRPRHDANSVREFLAKALMKFDEGRRV
jgi:hypothetical protein